jgi:Flp pilus assembly pilin Flp
VTRQLTFLVPDGIITYTNWPKKNFFAMGGVMVQFFRNIWQDEQGQDIAEYAVMLAVILVLVIGTVRLIGTSANTVFSNAASAIQ